MNHPAWKRKRIRKATALRKKLSNKALSKRYGVPYATIRNWVYRKKGK